jgi:hypothetical protein
MSDDFTEALLCACRANLAKKSLNGGIKLFDGEASAKGSARSKPEAISVAADFSIGLGRKKFEPSRSSTSKTIKERINGVQRMYTIR